jgi:hypothetical protein
VAGSDLDVAQVHARVEHGRDECVSSVRTRRVPKDCVVIGSERIVVLDFGMGVVGCVAIPGRVL